LALSATPDPKAPDLKTAAGQAWLAVLPLIEMAAARTRMTDPGRPGQHAGLNAFSYAGKLVGPKDRGITTPNNDTLYASAFIDLTRGPVRLTVPDLGARYASVAVMDFYTNNNVVLGARTPGGAAGDWRLIGPGQTARDSRDLKVLTPHAWVLVRVLVDGDADLAAAREALGRFILSGPQPASAPPPWPVYATRAADWSAYFRSAQALLAAEPPTWTAGLAALDTVRAAGHGAAFDPAGYSAGDAAAIAAGVATVRAAIEHARDRAAFIQGWSYPKADMGQYGDDFVLRAAVAVAGLGALPREEALYLRPAAPDGTAFFKGDGLYRLSLPEPLPVDGFWSLTLYQPTPDGQFFLADNPIDRYAVGDRTAGLRRGPKGELDLWISRTDPGGERSANWLPAPASGDFTLTLRAYLPRKPLLDGTYRVPAVVGV
jgi:hypothetical protein